ncbi:adenylate/guanylate cyclase domain-containing protein [Sphingomonas sp. BK069]|uniref:adenylate/guanylate cyclase domain-containing protein n=1 Tax=Sphingomonas sp. BK069 TaxID=2586979 RepID=UPI0016163E0D|nr:adenylate/guanylate cyclase domain-containing protein [Sphingomonas sp. BK069]MBB3348394.1 class 3 adenylate cyclase [Sphingomonas sp. BK069]
MTLRTDLDEAVAKIFRDPWSVTDGVVVPESTDLTLSNTGRSLDATVLYADLAASTRLVDGWSREFAAEIYKTFLLVAAKLIRSRGGTITAYDGDRIMAVYVGKSQSSDAVKTALQLHWACDNIIQPRLQRQYPTATYSIAHTCGIDHSPVMAAKTGVRGANDLVWVGRAANYAAKLSNESSTTPTWITEDVYRRLSDETRYGGDPRQDMWAPHLWSSMNNQLVYRSNWHWSLA